MDIRRLSLILMLGGAGAVLLALVWFVAAYAGAAEMMEFMGDEFALKMLSCLYSSSAICQGAGMFSDGPSYSPVLFWIGLIGVLAGVVIRLSAGSSGGGITGGLQSDTVGLAARSDAKSAGQDATGEIMGFIPPEQYARYSYILMLSGAVGGLIVSPLAVVALAGAVLALLGLTVYRPRLNRLDAQHLGLICLVFVAATVLMLATRGTFLFLLVALAQIACFYVGFNSYRHRRTVNLDNLKNEFRVALMPGMKAGADHDPD